MASTTAGFGSSSSSNNSSSNGNSNGNSSGHAEGYRVQVPDGREFKFRRSDQITQSSLGLLGFPSVVMLLNSEGGVFPVVAGSGGRFDTDADLLPPGLYSTVSSVASTPTTGVPSLHQQQQQQQQQQQSFFPSSQVSTPTGAGPNSATMFPALAHHPAFDLRHNLLEVAVKPEDLVLAKLCVEMQLKEPASMTEALSEVPSSGEGKGERGREKRGRGERRETGLCSLNGVA
jgi:hypothetical protein